MAVIGWLMFGNGVRDEITANILLSSGYPRVLSICMTIFIAVIPITKVPLKYVSVRVQTSYGDVTDAVTSCRPLVATIEVLCGLHLHQEHSPQHDSDSKKTAVAIGKGLVRIAAIVLIVLISVVFPSFDRIMALMGSCLCFTICIILPLAFYLRIFGHEISIGERIVDWTLLVTSSIMAAIGTVWAFLPAESIVGR